MSATTMLIERNILDPTPSCGRPCVLKTTGLWLGHSKMSPLSSFSLGDKWSQREWGGDGRLAEHFPTSVLLNTLLRNNLKMILV